MEHTEGKWEVISRKDDSFDNPYYEYHIISYPYGKEAGPQRITELCSKFDAHRIVTAVNSHDGLVEENEKLKALCLRESLMLQETVNRGARHNKSMLRVIATSLFEASQGTLASIGQKEGK